MKTFSRRTVLAGGLGAAGSVLISPWAFATGTEAKILPLEFAASARNFSALPMILATEQGYFKEEGLSPTDRYMGSNDVGMNLAVGNLHLGRLATDYVFLLNAKGTEPLVKVVAGNINKPFHSLIANKVSRAGKTVERPEDLRGATLAIPSRGGGGHLQMRIFLRRYGLEEGRDYTTFNAKGVKDQLMALNIPRSKPGVDALTLSPPWNFVLLEEKEKHVHLGEIADVI